MIKLTPIFHAAAIVISLTVSQACAQANRTWVSGVGNDANPCSRTQPCLTFAGAIAKTDAGGEIDALDPGGFGVVTINKAITIDGGPNAGGVLSGGTDGIVISAGNGDIVTLRNITINGMGTGNNGIKIQSGGVVHIQNCEISSHIQKGIDCQTPSPLRLFVSDTIIRDNANALNGGGIFVKATGGNGIQVYLDRVHMTHNTFGLRVEDRTTLMANDCSFVMNSTHGLIAVGPTGTFVNIDRCNISTNTGSGLRSVNANANVRFSSSMIDRNGTGLDSVSSGKLVSFGNNAIDGNLVDGAPTSTVPLR